MSIKYGTQRKREMLFLVVDFFSVCLCLGDYAMLCKFLVVVLIFFRALVSRVLLVFILVLYAIVHLKREIKEFLICLKDVRKKRDKQNNFFFCTSFLLLPLHDYNNSDICI